MANMFSKGGFNFKSILEFLIKIGELTNGMRGPVKGRKKRRGEEKKKTNPVAEQKPTKPKRTYEEITGKTPTTEEKPSSSLEEIFGTTTSSEAADKLGKRRKIISTAAKYQGIPYTYGGETPKGFDCSGFTQYVYAKAKVKLPRVSRSQAKVGKRISRKKAKPGDLVFFVIKGSSVSHVGIVTSQAGEPLSMIHASTSKGVMYSQITGNGYWSPKVHSVRSVV